MFCPLLLLVIAYMLEIRISKKDRWEKKRNNKWPITLNNRSETNLLRASLFCNFIRAKKVLKYLLSLGSGTCGMDHYVLVRFIFQIQPVLLMCKHLEEKRDFTYCPDEQRAQGRPTKRTSESCWTRILYAAWMGSFDKIKTINLW